MAFSPLGERFRLWITLCAPLRQNRRWTIVSFHTRTSRLVHGRHNGAVVHQLDHVRGLRAWKVGVFRTFCLDHVRGPLC